MIRSLIIIIIVALHSCKPSDIIYIKQDSINFDDLPSMCSKQHMLFYEVRSDSVNLVFWLKSKKQETIERISKKGILFISSEKRPGNVNAIVHYRENMYASKDTVSQNMYDGQIIKIQKINKKDTADITGQYNVSLESLLKNYSFELKLTIPKELFLGKEEPVAGIIIPKIETEYQEDDKTHHHPRQNMHPSHHQQAGNLTYVNQGLQPPHSQKIELWFQLKVD